MRATALWLVPSRSASWCWVRPRWRRASRTREPMRAGASTSVAVTEAPYLACEIDLVRHPGTDRSVLRKGSRGPGSAVAAALRLRPGVLGVEVVVLLAGSGCRGGGAGSRGTRRGGLCLGLPPTGGGLQGGVPLARPLGLRGPGLGAQLASRRPGCRRRQLAVPAGPPAEHQAGGRQADRQHV